MNWICPALQVIDGALSAVLRNYEVAKRETGLSTNVLCFPELDIFLGKMPIRELLDQYGQPVPAILDGPVGVCRKANSGDYRRGRGGMSELLRAGTAD